MNSVVIGLTFLALQLMVCTADMISAIVAAQSNGAEVASILAEHGVLRGAPKNAGRLGLDLCTYHDVATKSTFDLSPLELSSTSSYSVRDTFDTFSKNYTYVFNVCGAAAKPSASCGDDVSNQNVAAYQIRNSDGHCYHLNWDSTDRNWTLVDPTDPTRGVMLTYNNGDACGKTKRELEITFLCADIYSNQPSTRVTETSTCHYELAFESVFGCPLECPFSNRKLCGGHGVCGIDTDLGAPRCFCDSQHTGVDCSQDPPTPPVTCDGVCVAMAILVVLLGLLLIVSCVIFFRVQKLEKMNVRFTALSDTFVQPSTSAADRVN